MEAIVLAGGRAQRLGEAAGGLPKPLVPAAGRPLMAYQVRRLARAGVDRVIVSCTAGQEDLFVERLADLGPEIVCAGEERPLGRGGGLRFAARLREQDGPVFALNGDELLDLDYRVLLEHHRRRGGAATLTVVPLRSALGVVDVGDEDRIAGFREAPVLPHWVSAGVYVFEPDALAALPEEGDQETTTFPALAAEGRLFAYRFEGLWLTVNTPKDLARADEYLRAHPEWLA